MNCVCRHVARCVLFAIELIAFTACGGGSSPPRAVAGTGSAGSTVVPPAMYTLGGTVSGLVGNGLTIELLNLANVTHHTTILEQIDIVANGAFVFRMRPSKHYGVVIVHQPHSPAQWCVVRNGQGVIGTANAADVEIVCAEYSRRLRV